jgi:hypothetical protein
MKQTIRNFLGVVFKYTEIIALAFKWSSIKLTTVSVNL